MSVRENCVRKFQFLSGGDFQTLFEVREVWIAQILGGDSTAELSGEGRSRAQVAIQEFAGE